MKKCDFCKDIGTDEKAETFDALYSVYATLNGTKFADGLREKHRKVIAGNSKRAFAEAVKLEKEIGEIK